MAFGDTYGYKTTNRFVAAVATSDVEGEDGDAVVDVVLLGFANGQRKSVPVAVIQPTDPDAEANEFADVDAVPNNYVVAAADVTQAPVVFEDGVRF